MTTEARHQVLFEQKLGALGIEVDDHDRGRLWSAYVRQVELAAEWAARLDPAAEPALEFRVFEENE